MCTAVQPLPLPFTCLPGLQRQPTQLPYHPACRSCNPPVPTDGYYQVIVVAYNQYGFKRSEASNIVAVGAPSGNSQPLAVWAGDGDGDGKITIRFPTPAVRTVPSRRRPAVAKCWRRSAVCP